MKVKDFDALKKSLVKLVVVILLIRFLEKAIDWNGEVEFLWFGVAIALVIAAATWNLRQSGGRSDAGDR